MSKVEWPQRLTIHVHDQDRILSDDMANWLAERDIDRDSEEARLIASAAYEHEMEYEAWPDGTTRLVAVDGRPVQYQGCSAARNAVDDYLTEVINGNGNEAEVLKEVLDACPDKEDRAAARMELRSIRDLVRALW